MSKFNWKWFIGKIVYYILLIVLKIYTIVPLLERHIGQLASNQFSNDPTIIRKMEFCNFVISALDWFVLLIPFVLFWTEIVYLFNKFKNI